VDAVKECEQLQHRGVGNKRRRPEKMLPNGAHKQFVDLVDGKRLLSTASACVV